MVLLLNNDRMNLGNDWDVNQQFLIEEGAIACNFSEGRKCFNKARVTLRRCRVLFSGQSVSYISSIEGPSSFAFKYFLSREINFFRILSVIVFKYIDRSVFY